jgi:hypothetical protein
LPCCNNSEKGSLEFWKIKVKTEKCVKAEKIMVPFVLNPGERVCADPGKGDATLGVERDSEHQLGPDRGGGKT